MPTPEKLPRWALWAGTGIVAVLALMVLAWLPVHSDPRYSICFSRRILHVSCPGCGMTRAFALLARGDLSGSLSFHPLAVVVALEAAVLWLAWPLVLLGRVARPSHNAVNGWLLAHAGLLIVLWLIRLITGTLP